MKNHFKFINAKEYCSNIFDGTHDTPQPIEQGYKLLTSKNISQGILDKTTSYYISEEDYNSINLRSKVSQWDILFSMIGTVGNTCLILESDIDYAIKNIGVFSTNNEYKAKWLYIYLNSYIAKRYINKFLSGAVQKYITLDMLRNFPILIPYYDERYFVDLYWKITNKIQLNNSINDEQEKMAKTLYDYWFVQFDFPDENGRPYKSSGGKMVWSEELQREIPYGWEVKNIDNILSNRQVKSITPDANTLYKYYSLPSVAKSKSYELEYGKNILSSKYIVDNDCVLINKLNPLDSRVVYVPNKTNQICSTEFIVLKQTNHFIKSFIYSILSSDHFQLYCKQRISGAIHKRVSPRLVYDYKFPYNNSLVNNFGKIIINLLEKKTNLIKQNQELTSLRDFLLPLLMNGQAVIKE